MKKRLVGALSVAVALVAPALVFAQVARFAQNEPLTVTRMDQLVNAINNVNYAAPVLLTAINGNTAGGPVTGTITAQSPGILLLVPAGGGVGDVELNVKSGATTIARSTAGNSLTLPIGAGQSLIVSISNAAGDTPHVNPYFISLTGGAVPNSTSP